MNVKTSVVFDHRGRTAENKEGPVEIRVTVGRKPYYINTGIHVKRNEWLGAVVNRTDIDELNERLRWLVKRVQALVNESLMAGDAVDVVAIRQKLYASDSDASGDAFLEWVKKMTEELNVREGTRKHYVTLQVRLQQFGKIRGWRDLTVENIYEWDRWLHQLTKPQSNVQKKAQAPLEYIGNGSVNNYHKCLRALLAKAFKLGKIEQNPYDRLRGEFKKYSNESTEYLTDEEMQAIMNIHPLNGSQLAVARDLFVFQMFTGLSYSDVQAFDFSEYRKVDGVWVNIGSRIKTGTPYISQLLPPAVEVLEKYGWQTPQISNADYNQQLKTLGIAAGIKTRLHSHLARHTFATWMLRNGASIENVSKMLGHTNIMHTQRYAKVVAESVHEDFNRVRATLECSDGVATDDKQ